MGIVHGPQDRHVESLFVSKVIIDSRYICRGAFADLAYGGRAIAVFGKNLTGCFQEALLRPCR